MQWLVEQGLDPEEGDEYGVNPLNIVSDVKVKRYFVEPEPLGLNCNCKVCTINRETLLHFGVCRNRHEIVKYLICKRKYDSMQCDNNGNTCPHLAASHDTLMVLKFLFFSQVVK